MKSFLIGISDKNIIWRNNMSDAKKKFINKMTQEELDEWKEWAEQYEKANIDEEENNINEETTEKER